MLAGRKVGGLASISPMISIERWRSGWLDLQERALSRMDRLAEKWHGRPAEPEHLATGIRGEVAALFELRRRGYTIVARRWSTGTLRGDVDLIGWDGEWLCFIEVKTRTGRTIFPADKSVDAVKKRTLRSLALAYLKPYQQRQQRVLYRFDVVSVYLEGDGEGSGTVVEIIPNAFERREELYRGNR